VSDDSPADRERVYNRIAPLILEFQRRCGEKPFHAEELRTFVRDRVPEIAPASPDRILRQLRLEKRLGYEVVNRRASLYRFRQRKRYILRQEFNGERKRYIPRQELNGD
jgi:hypothetical protein